MGPDEVHTVKFRKPRIGTRGYDEEAVDILIDRIEATLRGDGQITRDELTTLKLSQLPIGKRAYRKQDVDTFLQRVLAEWPA